MAPVKPNLERALTAAAGATLLGSSLKPNGPARSKMNGSAVVLEGIAMYLRARQQLRQQASVLGRQFASQDVSGSALPFQSQRLVPAPQLPLAAPALVAPAVAGGAAAGLAAAELTKPSTPSPSTEADAPEANGPEANGPEANGPEANGPEANGPEASETPSTTSTDATSSAASQPSTPGNLSVGLTAPAAVPASTSSSSQ